MDYLSYGKEVLIRETPDSVWEMNWFERIGDKGFHTTEKCKAPCRFIAYPKGDYLGKTNNIPNQIDFNHIKKWFTSLKNE